MSLPKNSDTINFVIIVPFFNEEQTIYPVCAKLLESGYPVIFVNDGSTDRGYDILFDVVIKTKVPNISILSYPTNRGKGYAIKQGAKEAIKKGYEYMLFFDSDGQNAIEDVANFLSVLKYFKYFEQDPKIIIGNRLIHPKGMSRTRFLTNKFMSWLISKLAGKHIIDSQCGMRLVHKDIFAHTLENDGFGLESEMLIKAGRLGYDIKNVPIQCIYDKKRVSKISPIKDTLRFIKMIYRLLTNSNRSN